MVENITPSIRWASEDDRKAQREVTRAAWEDAYRHIFDPEEIHGLFTEKLALHADWLQYRKEKIGSFVAELGNTIVGTAGFALLHDGDGEVTSLYVLPQYQYMGIGKRLWDECAAELRKRGCKRMTVWTLDRADAVNFYEHIGCQLMGHGKFRLGDHEEDARGYCIEL
jgi:ribosomal protein S18 acetylase RimI-like enzyme